MLMNFTRAAVSASLMVAMGVPTVMASESGGTAKSPAIEPASQTHGEALLSADYIVLEYPDFGVLKMLPEKDFPPIYSGKKRSEPYVTEVQNEDKNNADDPLLEQTSSDEPFTLDNLDLSGLDPDIARKVASAMNKIDQQSAASANHILLEENTSKYQGRLPPLNLQTHMYSSDSQRRWIKINGQELREGDRLNNIQIVEITPQLVTIRFDNELIDIPALYEWGG
ncbi:general secretion pathway protein GspB [Vibrio cionasavignyae]|uniref:general secretion pathway protein GspB n=1 Tax=Vibrio cionasavignyae TaxID=2910252 RepID=UPI003D0A73C8